MLNAVGRHYSALGPRASTALILTAIPLVQLVANVLGVPISYNHIVITSIAGCGIASSRGSIDRNKLAVTISSGVVILIGSFHTAYALYTAITFL